VGSSVSWLQKWQTNGIFETIRSVGLDPREFDLENSQVDARIKHKLSESYFFVGGDAGHYVGRSVVGDGVDRQFDEFSWQPLIARVRRWFEEVKRDLATPDLWAELQRETELLRGHSDDSTENTLFTPSEQSEIASRLLELKDRTTHAYSLSVAQMQVLDAKIDYLTHAADRLGRIDWRNAFVGVILGYLLVLALPPESAHDIVVQMLLAIGPFYGFPALPIR
jgi:hypothetical protein